MTKGGRCFKTAGSVHVALVLLVSVLHSTDGFIPASLLSLRSVDAQSRFARPPVLLLRAESESPTSGGGSSGSTAPAPETPPPVLNGKRVLPYRVMAAGLSGHKIPAVYAVLNSSYKRGSDGWDAVEHVGVTQDLDSSLQSHLEAHGSDKVVHVRALSFSFPQPNAMQDVAADWRGLAKESGSQLSDGWANDVMDFLYDDEDEDEDDEDDWSVEMTAQAVASVPSGTAEQATEASQSEEIIISPFEQGSSSEVKGSGHAVAVAAEEGGEELSFTAANIDKVLDEVRPYLISDGGNVSVGRVDEENKKVYLKLEGACGSCPSSTVTMQMGIERVLKENFPDIQGVMQVEEDPESQPTELSWKAVEDEVNRLKPAVIAMGGAVELLSVDPVFGVAELKYKGANKVQQGLELALLDLPMLNSVKFVMFDE